MKKYFLLAITLLFFFIAVKAKHNYVDAELISEVKSIQPGKDFWVALKLNAKPDWHTYWRNPGDSGLPTTIEWTLPEGFQHSEIHWPNPHIFTVEGITNYGYEKEIVLPVKITVPQNLTAGQEITIKAKASWLACRVECVPEGEDLKITLPVKKQEPVLDENPKEQIENSLSNLPELNSDINVSAELKENIVTISADGKLGNFKSVRFFPYETGYFNNSADQKFLQKENRFSLHIPLDDFKIGIPKKVYGILYFVNAHEKSKSVEININLKK